MKSSTHVWKGSLLIGCLASLVAIAVLLAIAVSASRKTGSLSTSSIPMQLASDTNALQRKQRERRVVPPQPLVVVTNSAAITINNNAAATPYPSNITVSGVSGTITDVNVILHNVSVPRASDLDILLVGPGGQKFVVTSDAGGNTSVITNVTATFDSQSATVFGDSGGTGWGAPNTSSTSRPANYSGLTDTFPAPAPAGPYQHPVDGDLGASGTATFDSVFDGANPNGTWSLYVVDDSAAGTAGSIAGGWSLDITTANLAVTSTTLTSSVNPSFTAAPNGQTTLTATVTSGGPVTTGTVDFKDGTTVFQAGVALNGSGQAVLNHTFSLEGNRQVTAVYNGTASFATSTSNIVSQEVNNHTTVVGNVFSNDLSGITIVENNGSNGGVASPYPSKIFVSGVSGTISDLNVVLHNVTEPRASDIDILLVGPLGQKFVLVSDAGGNTSAISNVTTTFDDSAATIFGDSGDPNGWGPPNSSSSSRPVNQTSTADTFPAPAPAGPYQFPEVVGVPPFATLASVFNGSNPNGTWSLFLLDDSSNAAGSGSVAGGWSLNFTFSAAPATTTVVNSNNNPSFTAAPNNSVTFTATVTNGSTVNEGTVTFKDNGVALPGASTVNVVNGQAQFTTTFAAEDNHPITAVYNGTANFATSTGSVGQEVNNHTTVNGNMFSNSLSGIAINDQNGSNQGKATPYPSRIFVSGLSGNIGDLNVTLHNVSEPRASDIDILLVGPLGQKFVLVSDAGGNTSVISNVTVTFDDSSSTLFGDSGSALGWGAPGTTTTARPVNRTDTSDTFPVPAPAGPYQFPEGDGGGTATLASVFNGTNPNGTWSLYLIDDGSSGGQNGTIAGGWTLTFAPLLDVSVKDAKALEPPSVTTQMIFTVALTAVPSNAVMVHYATADDVGGAHPATSGVDYTPTSGDLTFSPGQQIKTVAVDILPDLVSPDFDETLLLNLSTPSGANISDGQAVGTITQANPAGTFLISELRTSGPASNDTFIEFYNNSDSPLTISASDASTGYGVFKMGVDCNASPVLIATIPNGTIIKGRGHYLVAGTGYSLSAYAAPDQTLSADLEQDRNVAVFNTANPANLSSVTRLDAIGFGSNGTGVCQLLDEGTNLEAVGGSSLEYSFQRDPCGKGGNPAVFGVCSTSGLLKDTNNNAADFLFASTTGAGPVVNPHLGAPGPENLASPVLKTTMPGLLLDALVAQASPPNRVRDFTVVPNGANGTLTIRRRFVNNTGAAVTRLRFRIVDISAFPVTGATADVRALSSGAIVVNGITDSATCLASNGVATTPCNVNVQGTTLEQPPTQTLGGANNSSLSVGTITLGAPVGPGGSVNIQFVLGVQVTGTFKFFVNVEALP